jgi:hypothetical protein
MYPETFGARLAFTRLTRGSARWDQATKGLDESELDALRDKLKECWFTLVWEESQAKNP